MRPGSRAAPARPRRLGRRSRPRRWADALAELRALQAEYSTWRDQLPEALADSRTAERLEEVCDVDLSNLDGGPLTVELPQGFGRDLNVAAPRRARGRPKGSDKGVFC